MNTGLKVYWAQSLLDMLYLEEDTMAWAQADQDSVKGSSITAKRGTAVRNISLVHDNHGQIEGRVEGQRSVILTEFVKKT